MVEVVGAGEGEGVGVGLALMEGTVPIDVEDGLFEMILFGLILEGPAIGLC